MRRACRLVALHGGGARAAYFDSPVDPSASLIRLTAGLGWRAVALDRPGYGASAGYRGWSGVTLSATSGGSPRQEQPGATDEIAAT